ncbi:SpoIIE family protein phosphatase [Actinacidiphila acididurans]|uniref:SpoIIE family protein phosphatase n=1 Tax=Actinacidiphila acididurans TaxID=2784346 RepID=A0ABS2TWG8_9ACTN|nr:SpoIIE family protein phosphatase [Actinacidiphila acididurans]MBM9507688.1 SpoIIE family protein phosphatase [Actinacidiphila acididurans]
MRGNTAGTATGETVRAALDALVLDAVRRTGAHSGALYLLEPGGEVLCLEAGSGVSPRFAEPVARLKLPPPGATEPSGDPVIDAVRDRRLVWLGTDRALSREYPKAALVFPHRFAMAVAPLTEAPGAPPRGALVLLWPPSRPARLGAAERKRIEAACATIAWVLAQAQAGGTRLEPSAEPRRIDPGGPADQAPAEPPASAFLERLPEGDYALDADGRVTFADRTAAGLLGPDATELTGRLLWETVPWLDNPLFEYQFREALFSQQPTSFTAVRPPDRPLLFELYPDSSGVSVRITPARTRRSVPGRPASTGSGQRLGTAHHLLYLAASLGETVRLRDVVELATDRFLGAFGAQDLALLAPDAGRARVIGHSGFDADFIDRVDGTVLTDGVPEVLGPAARVPAFYASREELCRSCPDSIDWSPSTAAWAFLPLVVSGRHTGTCVLGFARPHRFTREERAVLASIGNLVGQALERARLYDAQARLAHGLQAGLLPHRLPVVPGLEVAARYLPASHGMDIGGDFYDLIRIGPTEVAAVIGDVQGHSVTAAAHMGQVRTTVHAYAAAGAPPGEILARTNRLLTDLGAELLTSCLYVHVDLARHRALLASAGHRPPLLRAPDGRAGVLAVPPGILLGIDPAATYPTTAVPLPPGAVLTLYTDGLVEAGGRDDDAVVAVLTRVLDRAGGPLDRLAEEMIARAQPHGERTDDTALLLLRP